MKVCVEDCEYFVAYRVAMDRGELDEFEVRLSDGLLCDKVEPYTVDEILLEFSREMRYRGKLK